MYAQITIFSYLSFGSSWIDYPRNQLDLRLAQLLAYTMFEPDTLIDECPVALLEVHSKKESKEK